MNLVVGAFWFRLFFFFVEFSSFLFFFIGNVENKGVKSEKAEEGCYDRNQPNILRPPSPAAAGSTCILRAYSSCKDIKVSNKTTSIQFPGLRCSPLHPRPAWCPESTAGYLRVAACGNTASSGCVGYPGQPHPSLRISSS